MQTSSIERLSPPTTRYGAKPYIDESNSSVSDSPPPLPILCSAGHPMETPPPSPALSPTKAFKKPLVDVRLRSSQRTVMNPPYVSPTPSKQSDSLNEDEMKSDPAVRGTVVEPPNDTPPSSELSAARHIPSDRQSVDNNVQGYDHESTPPPWSPEVVMAYENKIKTQNMSQRTDLYNYYRKQPAEPDTSVKGFGQEVNSSISDLGGKFRKTTIGPKSSCTQKDKKKKKINLSLKSEIRDVRGSQDVRAMQTKNDDIVHNVYYNVTDADAMLHDLQKNKIRFGGDYFGQKTVWVPQSDAN